MKIAFIAAGRLPIPAVNGGATETMLTQLLKQNEIEKSFKATVFCFHNSQAAKLVDEYTQADWQFYMGESKLNTLSRYFWRGLRKLTAGRTYLRTDFIKWCADIINKQDFDVVLVEGNHFQVLQLKKAVKVPVVLHMHIDGLTTATDNGFNILSSCKGVIAISEYCKKRISEIDESQGDKVYVLKNNIRVDHFCSENRMDFRENFRARHGIKPNQKLFVYCGRLDAKKGVRELLEAFIALDNKDYFLMIIGSSFFKGSKKDSFIKNLEKMALPYKDRIIFTGYVSQEELPNYYAAADISVMPSKWEAAGNVIIEALACGLPVVASNVGGIPEYANQESCLLVELNEEFYKNLANAMQALASDDKLYYAKKEKARALSLEYDIVNYYKNFCSIINNIMEQ